MCDNGPVIVGMPRMSGRALQALLPDIRGLPGPVYSALCDAIVSLVLDGRVAAETRLPSERELALQLRLSRATVTAAYDRLRAQGFLQSRTGAGSYVTLPVGTRPTPSAARWSPPATHTDEIDLSCAALPAPPGLFPGVLIGADVRIAELGRGSGYDPLGLPELREAIAARFRARGVATDPDQIIVTNGSLHAFDLLLRLLLGPGDRVLVELPTYPGALDALRSNGARIMPVPVAPGGGWQVGHMQATLRQTAPRLALLIPDFHNPTGALVGEDDRRGVLRTARTTGTTVVIDESFFELGYDGTPITTAGIDPSVVTIGSLSKPVWGGLRLGWVRGSTDLVRRLAAQRAATDLAGSALDQVVGIELFARLDEIVQGRRAELRPRRDALLAALAAQLPEWQVPVPAGGLSVWAELDAPLATALTVAAAQYGVILVSGSRFGIDGTLERFLRLPFSLPIPRLEEAVSRLADAWHGLDRSRAELRQLVVA
jgi:DNA-binding transcriptional MocR family regulator